MRTTAPTSESTAPKAVTAPRNQPSVQKIQSRRLLPLLVLLTCDLSNQLEAQGAERDPPQMTGDHRVLPPVRTGRAVAGPISSVGGKCRGGRKRKARAPNQILEPRSDWSYGPWASERGARGACPPGPIGASPQCGASASNARVSQLIVSSRELFFAATERSRSRRSRDPRGGGERRRGRRSRGCFARGSGSCHGSSWGWRLGWVGGKAQILFPSTAARSPAPSFPRSLARPPTPS